MTEQKIKPNKESKKGEKKENNKSKTTQTKTAAACVKRTNKLNTFNVNGISLILIDTKCNER